MRLLPCGDRAILVEVADSQERRRLDATLRRRPLPGTVEHVPGARTVLVVATSPDRLPGIATALRDLVLDAPGVPEEADEGAEVVVDVHYDGPDLDDVARHLGISPRDVVTRHTGQVWTVEFAGFAPGFAYLTGTESDLEVPRRGSPRTRIPSGSVGLAGPNSGVYPRSSPGGWQLIGRTEVQLWDPDRDPPALLTPGRRVRFVEVPP
jgi:KipI family sensor histidine kinase inhibitor